MSSKQAKKLFTEKITFNPNNPFLKSKLLTTKQAIFMHKIFPEIIGLDETDTWHITPETRPVRLSITMAKFYSDIDDQNSIIQNCDCIIRVGGRGSDFWRRRDAVLYILFGCDLRCLENYFSDLDGRMKSEDYYEVDSILIYK